MRVLLTARRKDRMLELVEEIGGLNGKVDIYPADLNKSGERMNLFGNISQSHNVDILINNAGFGWYGYYHRMPWETARQMIAVNIEAAAHLTSLFLPGMVERKNGHIINIGSIAGGFPNQGVALYSASKSFLDAFTTSLHRELRSSGVHASVIRLGPVKTEFFEQARKLENGGSIPAERLAVSVGTVNQALWRLMAHPRRVMYIPGWLWVTQFADPFLGNIVDSLGPLLLRKTDK